MSPLIRSALFALLLPIAVSAQSTSDPVIDQVTPNSGTSRGGTIVNITGRNLDPMIACLLPCPTRVFFGDQQAEITELRSSSFTVVTPPHAAGTVDVSVVIPGGRTATAPGAFTYIGTAEDGYERVLLPIYVDGKQPGNNGSIWLTDLWIRNNGMAPAVIAPVDCGSPACPAIFPSVRSLQPNETIHGLGGGQSNIRGAGRILYVSGLGTPMLSWQLRVLDSSSGATNAGTELPVVHERDFRRAALQLHNIPTDVRFRLLLRVYEMNVFPSASFRIRVFAESEGVFDVGPEFDGVVETFSSESGPFRSAPGYVQMAIPIPDPRPPAKPLALLRVQVEPLTPGSAFWSFVTITSNQTQVVTTVTPQ